MVSLKKSLNLYFQGWSFLKNTFYKDIGLEKQFLVLILFDNINFELLYFIKFCKIRIAPFKKDVIIFFKAGHF